jgi:polyisoprenoid-binding protein YceI
MWDNLHRTKPTNRVTVMKILLLAVPVALLICQSSQAHHAFAADYESGKEGTVSGVITEVVYKNPHARYYIEVSNDDGSRDLWDLETMNLMMLGRMGWKKDTIQIGDQVTVSGILGRDNTKRMSITTVELPGGRVISPVRSLTTTNAELNQTAQDGGVDKEFVSIATEISPGRYEVDETHAYLSFSYSHMGLSNPRLHFADFDAELELDGNNMANSSVRIAVDAASVDSGVAELDDELRGADFFDVANHPNITFVSSGYKETSENAGTLSGDLTVMGITRPVTLDVTINSAAMNRSVRKEMIGFSAAGMIKRSEFGLTAYDKVVSDELNLDIQIEFARAN